MRKILSLGLILSLIASLSVTAFAALEMPYADVPEDAPYAEEVLELYEYEIMNGDEKGNFNPDSPVKRQEMAAIVCRLLDETEGSANTGFTDVPATHWAAVYVAKAAELGIVNGYGNGLFGPGDSVTVDQAIKMMVCARGYGQQAEEQGGWPNGYRAVAQQLGLLDGITEEGSAPAKRSTIAVIAYRTLMCPSADEKGGEGELEE